MAKKYRLKTKDGKDIVTVIYGGRAAYGRDTLRPEDVLKGKTPRQHCEELIVRWCPRKYAAEKNQAASRQRIV